MFSCRMTFHVSYVCIRVCIRVSRFGTRFYFYVFHTFLETRPETFETFPKPAKSLVPLTKDPTPSQGRPTPKRQTMKGPQRM